MGKNIFPSFMIFNVDVCLLSCRKMILQKYLNLFQLERSPVSYEKLRKNAKFPGIF